MIGYYFAVICNAIMLGFNFQTLLKGHDKSINIAICLLMFLNVLFVIYYTNLLNIFK